MIQVFYLVFPRLIQNYLLMRKSTKPRSVCTISPTLIDFYNFKKKRFKKINNLFINVMVQKLVLRNERILYGFHPVHGTNQHYTGTSAHYQSQRPCIFCQFVWIIRISEILNCIV
jgi:hypothetical protein